MTTKTKKQATKQGSNHRPKNWKDVRFWRDEMKWHHPVSLDEPDQVPVRGKIPDWVYERRGLEAPAPEAPQSIEASLAEGYNTTDLGNAQRLVKHYGSIIHYCEESKGWVIWDGKRWDRDYGVKINALAELTTRQIYSEATNEPDTKKRQELATHGKSSENDHRLTAMVHRAQSQMGVPVKANDLDSDPWLFNVENGTLNLKTGELLPHDQADLLTTLVPIEYDAGAECPRWLTFLNQVTNNDRAMIDYLQKAVGYSLTGNNKSQILFFLWGLGNNGKSTFINTIRTLTGSYGARISSDLLMVKEKASSGPKEGLANLRGKRFACCSELELDKSLATSLVKDLTGGESITADRKHEHQFEFLPIAKLWLVGNHKPEIKDTTLSIWRRMKLIPFNFTIPKGKVDPDLPQKLEAELPGILAWAVRGCLAWLEQGFQEPQAVIAATALYRQDQDVIGDFVEDCCALEHEASVSKSALKEACFEWCRTTGIDFISNWTLKSRLIERGITDGRSTDHKVRTWKGIRLLTDMDKAERLKQLEAERLKQLEAERLRKQLEDKEKADKLDKLNTNSPYPLQETNTKERTGKAGSKCPIKAKVPPNLSEMSEKSVDIPEHPTEPCHACKGSDFYLSDANVWTCSTCHPDPKGAK